MKLKSTCLLFFIISVSLIAQVVDVRTTGTGTTFDNAKNSALRNAVEQVLGTYIKSASEVENFILVKNKILSKSEGFCKSYDILKKTSQNGTWTVDLKVRVAKNQLEAELEDYAVIISNIGNPRVLVFYDKKTPKQLEVFTKQAIIRVNQYLLDRGFNVSDYDQLEEIMNSDEEWNKDLNVPITKVQELAQKFSADIFVTVSIDADYDGNTKRVRVITNMYTTTTAKKLGEEIGRSMKVMKNSPVTNDLIDDAVKEAMPGTMKRAMTQWKKWKK